MHALRVRLAFTGCGASPAAFIGARTAELHCRGAGGDSVTAGSPVGVS
jgi:hypothetical protein